MAGKRDARVTIVIGRVFRDLVRDLGELQAYGVEDEADKLLKRLAKELEKRGVKLEVEEVYCA
ncbi:MAG: hypothetical protein DRJ67_01495 [Thermoprotei archaeon]|nr:MAG: hypothetical protein DRJ67_01495 [Thermoprotei archaeon]